MARYTGKKAVSEETREEAMRIARGIQQPGQTKEQTKLIAQGIQKGIDLYKKQHKAKLRDEDRRRRKAAAQAESAADTSPPESEATSPSAPRASGGRLPWTLLVITWVAIAAYAALVAAGLSFSPH